jgi:ABC-type phosphonate transport system ATPase subunit
VFPDVELRRVIFDAELLISGGLNLSLHIYLLNLLLFLCRGLRLINVNAAHWLIVIELIHRGCIHDGHLRGIHVGPLNKCV